MFLRRIFKGHLVLAWLGLFALAPLMFGCQSDSARDQMNNQYASDFKAKKHELEVMKGFFRGKVHLLELNQDFDFQIILEVDPLTENSPQSEDPSETVPVARLGGSISFPALVNLPLEDYAGFLPLLNPLDGIPVATVKGGDYNPGISPSVTLPYLAQDKTTVFGTFDGDINGDDFSGTWYADDFGTVGTFDAHRVSTTPALTQNGSGS